MKQKSSTSRPTFEGTGTVLRGSSGGCVASGATRIEYTGLVAEAASVPLGLSSLSIPGFIKRHLDGRFKTHRRE